MTGYVITADPSSLSDSVLVADFGGNVSRIGIEDADPEHRFAKYRLAAGWFANLPAGFDPNEVR